MPWVKNWRSLVLALLFAGPFLVYVGFGFLWMLERGWLWPTVASIVWITAGIAFTLLAARWTKRPARILPYLDETAPETFSPLDQKAWQIVLDESESSEALDAKNLIELDRYIDTAKSLAYKLAKVYHPNAENPIESVPLLEALTALELAADDLSHLTREIPGSDLLTPSHVKTAVQAAGYIQKASEWYGYLLPLINPATGIPRLASQHLMVKPAWRDMQHNLLRWFYRAFINRLGVHLIELYSGRLVVGAENYRRLIKGHQGVVANSWDTAGRLTVAVAGSQFADAGHLTEAMLEKDPAALTRLVQKFEEQGAHGELADHLVSAEWTVVPPYAAHSGQDETSRDRSKLKRAIKTASEGDLLLLVIDERSEGREADIAFLKGWSDWYETHPEFLRPPVIVVVTHGDAARIESLRSAMPTYVDKIVPIEVGSLTPLDRMLALLPTLQMVWPRMDRVATVRHLSEASSRSKAGRLFRQLSSTGRKLFWERSKSHSEST